MWLRIYAGDVGSRQLKGEKSAVNSVENCRGNIIGCGKDIVKVRPKIEVVWTCVKRDMLDYSITYIYKQEEKKITKYGCGNSEGNKNIGSGKDRSKLRAKIEVAWSCAKEKCWCWRWWM